MANVQKKIGVDVSKKTLDLAIPQNGNSYKHLKIENESKAFKQLIKEVDKEMVFVMEASGTYYLPFAFFLYSKGFKVCVVNPLQVKHFSKMRMSRAKTDKKDAALIAQYAEMQEPDFWIPKEEILFEFNQLQSILDQMIKEKTVYQNQMEAFKSSGKITKKVEKIIKQKIESIKKEILKIEVMLDEIIQKEYAEIYKTILTIPGLGKKTARLLIYITDGFTKFENSKKLACYVGLCPRIYESGTSVKGRSRICKMGMAKVRKLLYLCAMRAIRFNKQCKEMYERLKANGKNGKLALVAVANKILRQAFAVATNKIEYSQLLT